MDLQLEDVSRESEVLCKDVGLLVPVGGIAEPGDLPEHLDAGDILDGVPS